MSQNMGQNQIGCLRALAEKGPYPGMWYWVNHSTTVQIMNSLIRRGFVEAYEVPDSRLPGRTVTHYWITENGRAALEIVK